MFPDKLSTLNLPFTYQFIYEKEPLRKEEFIKMMEKTPYKHRGYGYTLQLYSFFIMDQYFKENDIIAYTDVDAPFTMPVVDESIMDDNGRLIVKAFNSFNKIRNPAHVKPWIETTLFAIGKPMVADFMTFFPTYFFVRTIRNCREYIMHRHNVSSFEEFFITFKKIYCPVNIVYSYAYYFERDSYAWHIDPWPDSFTVFNQHLPKENKLRKEDTLPEIHETVHAKYYVDLVKDQKGKRYVTRETFQTAICYLQIHLGMKNSTYCPLNIYGEKPMHLLYEFDTLNPYCHHMSWMKDNFTLTESIVLKRYEIIHKLYQEKKLQFKTERIKIVDDFALASTGHRGTEVSYQPFESV